MSLGLLFVNVKNMVLNEKHFRVIKSYLKPFRTYVASEEFKTSEQEILEKIKTFQSLTSEKIRSLDEFSLGELFSKIWAFNFWGNKDYYIHRILSANGLENIKKALIDLFYGRGSIGERYEHFLKRVKYLGPAAVTDMLCAFNPEEYGIWNDKARKALKILGLGDVLPLNKYQITGKKYEKFNVILKEIGQHLKNNGFKHSDFCLS